MAGILPLRCLGLLTPTRGCGGGPSYPGDAGVVGARPSRLGLKNGPELRPDEMLLSQFRAALPGKWPYAATSARYEMVAQAFSFLRKYRFTFRFATR